MKIAYFGYNPFSSCLELLINQGHEVVCIYTGQQSIHTDRVIKCATQNQISVCLEKPEQSQMDALVSAGVELFLSAEYPWRIPIPDKLKFAINIHPTFLPYGRGSTPLPLLLLAYPEHAGITLHKMTSALDEGDILLQQKIILDEHESFDTLSAKLYIGTPVLLKQLLSNLNHYYINSIRQENGSNWDQLSQKDQTINWNNPTHQLLKQLRAFGSLGVYCKLQGQSYLITAAEAVVCPHNSKAGEIISIDEIRVTIASIDGLISIPRGCLLALR
jgi:methionyl-tRNA formyltransferase